MLVEPVENQFPLVGALTENKPSKSGLGIDFAELWAHRELLYFLTERDIKVRYKQTALGIAWVLLQPTLTTLLLAMIFRSFAASSDTEQIPYLVFALSGFVLWSFINNAINNTSNSLINQANLITKIYFPRLLLPLATLCAALADLLFSLPLLLLVMFYYGVTPSWKIIFAPLFLALLAIMLFAVGTLLAALVVRFRDIRHLLPFALQIWLFSSPIFYPFTVLPDEQQWLWRLNPMVGILNGFRASLLGMRLDRTAVTITVVFTIIMLLAGLIVFQRMEDDLVDII